MCFHPEGGLIFAKKMREGKYVTVLDPFQIKYGDALAAVQALALLVVDFTWVPGTLIGLGKNFHTWSIYINQPCGQP